MTHFNIQYQMTMPHRQRRRLTHGPLALVLALLTLSLGCTQTGSDSATEGTPASQSTTASAPVEEQGRWDPNISAPFETVDAATAEQQGCRSCHTDISVINERMQPHLLAAAQGRAGYECAICHEGKPNATTKQEAHEGMWPNPASMWVMGEGHGCAKCHSEKGALATVMGEPLEGGPVGGGLLQVKSELSDPSGRTGTNHVYRMQRSLMALETGKANKTLSSNGVIAKGTFPYSNFDMDDPDGQEPSVGSPEYKEWIKRAIDTGLIHRCPEVDAIPTFDEGVELFGDPAKAGFADMHRKQCARCHVWGEGRSRRGDHRAGGCASCHVLYTNDALYEGNDLIIPKDRGPHAMRHEITRQIPAQQCNHCHTRGKRIGTTYVGMVEHTYVGSGKTPPYDEQGDPQRKLYTKEYNHVRADVHSERGMDCADCHSSIDVHGDGNIYPVTYFQVEIGCQDCHGTPTDYPWELPVGYGTPIELEGPRGTYEKEGYQYLITQRGNPRTRWVKEGDKAFVVSIYTGKKHEVPLLKERQLTDNWKTPQGKASMSLVSQHLQTMECYACHSTWAAQCYGCHVNYDMRKQGTDWALSAMNRCPKGKQTITKTAGDIALENVGFVRWERPILGVNYKGRVTPLEPGCQVVWTFTDENGVVRESNRIYETSDGFPNPTLAPLNPHANTLVARTCESCHTDPKALGYGEGKSRSAKVLEGDIPLFANQGPGLFGDIPASVRATPQIPAIPGFPYTWDQLVTRSGKRVQNMPLPADHPLTDDQRNKMEREGLCVSCHKHYNTPTWDRVRERMKAVLNVEGRALKPEEHDRAVEAALLALANEPVGRETVEVEAAAANQRPYSAMVEWIKSKAISDHEK